MNLTQQLFGSDGDILNDDQFRLLLLANVNGATGIQLLAPILVVLTDPFDISAVETGLMITMFSAPGVIALPVVGMITDRFGRKIVLVISLLLFGIAGTMIAFTTSYSIVLALRFVQGIGFAGIIPTVISSIGDLYAGSQEVTAQGLRFTSTGVIQATAPLAAGAIVTVAWQFPFLFYSVAIPIGFAVLLWFDESMEVRDDTSKEGDGGNAADGVLDDSYLREFTWLVTRPQVAATIGALCVTMVAFTGFITYNSFIVVEAYGGNPGQAGVLLTVLSIVFAFTASQAGRVVRYFDSRFVPLVISNTCVSIGLITFALSPSLLISIPTLAIMGAGVGTMFTLLRSLIATISPEEYRGGLVGVGEASLRFASAATPILLGFTISFVEPMFQLLPSIQWTLVGTGVVTGLTGWILLVIAPSVPEKVTVRP